MQSWSSACSPAPPLPLQPLAPATGVAERTTSRPRWPASPAGGAGPVPLPMSRSTSPQPTARSQDLPAAPMAGGAGAASRARPMSAGSASVRWSAQVRGRSTAAPTGVGGATGSRAVPWPAACANYGAWPLSPSCRPTVDPEEERSFAALGRKAPQPRDLASPCRMHPPVASQPSSQVGSAGPELREPGCGCHVGRMHADGAFGGVSGICPGGLVGTPDFAFQAGPALSPRVGQTGRRGARLPRDAPPLSGHRLPEEAGSCLAGAVGEIAAQRAAEPSSWAPANGCPSWPLGPVGFEAHEVLPRRPAPQHQALPTWTRTLGSDGAEPHDFDPAVLWAK